MEEWLAALRPGDLVILRSYATAEIASVTRTTPTQIIIGNIRPRRFHRKGGAEIGHTGTWLNPYSAGEAAQIRLQQTQSVLYATLQKITRRQVEALTLEQCQAIHACLVAQGLSRRTEEESSYGRCPYGN